MKIKSISERRTTNSTKSKPSSAFESYRKKRLKQNKALLKQIEQEVNNTLKKQN